MKVSSLGEAIKRMPQYLYDSLIEQYDHNIVDNIIKGYMVTRNTTLRVNTLVSDSLEIRNTLWEKNIKLDKASFFDNAFIIKNANEKDFETLDIYKDGKIYLQSLSSMIPPLILNSKEGMKVLDMSAAPGGKTSELVALTNSNIDLTAVEIDEIRYQKLNYNLEKQHCENVKTLNMDARKLSEEEKYDAILLDAPCSGSGTIDLNDKKTYVSFSEKLVTKVSSTQYALLSKAVKLAKPGSYILYSTCSILAKENEDIVLKVMSENPCLEVISLDYAKRYNIPTLPCKIKGAIVICPNQLYEGFFVCKLRKKK
jgi:tRNA (cytosine40_48-C5)-methyltransferase